ncbi:MAG: amino acid aminotransferase [Planctomycetota bacterium]
MSSVSALRRFDAISPAPPDAILGLTEAFVADDRTQKMNLSVGVYKDADGVTPILRCVKAAEQRILETESSKGYLSIDGLPDYRDAVRELVFGDLIDSDRIAVVQTPGGTGAVRVAADFVADQCAGAQVWLPNPTWANHNAIMAAAGLSVESYRYLSADRRGLDFDAVIEDLQTKPNPGDAILLHACCHNPTGVDPSAEQWSHIAEVIADRHLLPILDFAYQGFGDGLMEDTAGLRAVLSRSDEALVCTSFSKNFGLYSERVGAVSVVASSTETASAALSQVKRLVRSNYSNPPRHGAAIVATVLNDADLRSDWQVELEAMRCRILDLRQRFVSGMDATDCDQDFSFLLGQKGMFSFSGLNRMQVDELRVQHGIYIVDSGRINVAGMSEDRMGFLCDAVASVL